MLFRKTIVILLATFLFTNSLIPCATAQSVVVTIGRPNIWSLEQAHYLLARMHHTNREIQANPLSNLDPNEINANQIKLLRQIFGLSVDYEQIKKPKLDEKDEGKGEKETAENKAELNTKLPESLLEKLPDNAFSDPKLNASTVLDNYINLQYEIIARELTLLRDEVGKDERLVFLELPHSIFTTDKKADKRLVQVWWRIDSYSHIPKERIRPYRERAALKDTRKNLIDLERSFNRFRSVVNTPKYTDGDRDKLEQEVRHSISVLKFLQSLADPQSALFKSLNPLLSSFRQFVNLRVSQQINPLNTSSALTQLSNALTQFDIELNTSIQPGCLPANEADNFDEVDQRNSEPTPTAEIIEFAQNGRGCRTNESIQPNLPPRVIDLIPRQSSLILNKTYDSNSGLNLFGGFSWLFGLGVKGNYQRQKEVFEQYLHQEVYASSFGKGETDFGWTFAPSPGTKRLNPGIRTTYAVLIVPKDAETISLKAIGCFFRQGEDQPYNYNAINNWPRNSNNNRACDDEETFIVRVPDGGDYQGFYVSAVNYLPEQEPGSRIAVSIKGQNLSPQTGVLVNGVSLRQSVGLAQPFLDKINSQDSTYQPQDGISGEVEYVDSDEIVFAFRMPASFRGTPTIHLIGPGRAIYLNKLPNVRVNGPVMRLEDAPRMFGETPASDLRVTDFKVFPTAVDNHFTGLLIGKAFDARAVVYINGVLQTDNIQRLSDRQIRFEFNADSGEEILATVANPDGDSDNITYQRFLPFILNQVTALSYDDGVMIVKIDGLGMKGLAIKDLKGADGVNSSVIPNGTGQAFLRLVKPEEVVKIDLINSNGQTAHAVVVRPKKPDKSEK